MPAGRPSWTPTEEQLEKVEQLGAAQCSIEEIAATLGIGQTTLLKYKNIEGEFATLIKGSQDKGKAFAKAQLFKQMAKGNVTALIFYLKTQCGWKEKIELSGNLTVTPIITPNLVEGHQWEKVTTNPDQLNLGDHKQDPKQPS